MDMASDHLDEPFIMSFPDPEPEPAQLSDSQSLAVVQIFLNAAVACVAYTRELIPWVSPCFQVCHVGQLEVGLDTDRSLYQTFCSLKPQDDDQSQEFRILCRGFDQRADTILNMLEIGIHESIILRYLKAIQLFITVDTDDPTAVLESYTFTFGYDGNGINQVQLSSKHGDNFSVKTIRKSFSTAIRALLRGMQDLPVLPRRRSLGISLTYNETCPKSYQPQGFVDVKNHQPANSQTSWASLWRGDCEPVALVNTGNHHVLVGAQSLKFSKNLSWSQMQDTDISTQLRNMQRTSSINRGIDSTVPGTAPGHPTAPARRTAAAPTLRQAGAKKTHAVKRKSSDDDEPIPQKRISRSAHDTPPTASPNPNISQNSLRTLTVRAKNRRRRNVVPSKLAELVVQARAMENEHDGDEPLFSQEQLNAGFIRRTVQSGEVNCECQSVHENNDMLYCELCGTRQHKKCYGYLGLRPGGLPQEHFCYNCLLLPREDQVNDSMPSLVQMRLALIYLAQLDHSNIEIDNAFHAAVFPARTQSSTAFLAILRRLCDEGYISTSGDGFLETIATDEKIEEAQTAYLDPLAGITQHYEVVRDGEGLEVRKKKIKSALKSYFGDRKASDTDTDNSAYDCIHIRDNAGCHVVRWGFYANWKPKGQLKQADPGKASIATQFMNGDRATPSLSIHEALGEAVHEADWLLRVRSRISPVGDRFK